jgi:hypothetical protein
MTRRGLFWGSVILLLGVLLLLQTLGILSFNVWPIFWALFLIFLGVWFLLRSRSRGQFTTESLSIPRNGAVQASVEIQHGAGRLIVGALTGGDALLEGSFTGGVSQVVQPGAQMRVKLNPNPDFRVDFPWNWPEGLRWDVRLTRDIPLDLIFRTGAGESEIDLTDLDVKSVRLKTGASSSRLMLPARAGRTRAEVKGGLASVNMIVPQGVAARIQLQTGLTGNNIDTNRFPLVGGVYQSSDYDSAVNKVDIFVEGGMGSFDVR